MFFLRKKNKPTIIPRSEHSLSRRDIDPDALKVLYRLSSLNHEVYLVGGSVRDLLLDRQPKDFDVGTDARPNEIRHIFRNCFLVGKRFRLAHIVFGKKVIETATFRKAPRPDAVQDEHGLYQYEDNTFGTPQEDALRRDFTVNGLFYDIKTFSIIDYVGGLKDLKQHTIRSIGDPCIRFREDPVRMMRAVRFAAKLNFDICSADVKAIKKYASELGNASISRLCEEIQRLFVKGATERSIRLAYEYGILKALLPSLHQWLSEKRENQEKVWQALNALDEVNATRETTNAVAFAMLFYPMVTEAVEQHRAKTPAGKRFNAFHARRMAAEKVLTPIVKHYRFPRALWMTAVDILELTDRMTRKPDPTSARDIRFLNHGIFPEILLGAEVFKKLFPSYNWQIDAWTELYRKAGPLARQQREGDFVPPANPHSRKARRRRPRGRRKQRGASAQTAQTENA
jgi:poly(A) polymerase